MTPARVVLAIVLSLQTGLAYAVSKNFWPAWTAWLMLGGVCVQAFMTGIQDPPALVNILRAARRERRAAARVPTLPVVLILLGFAGCVKGASVQQDPNGGVDACVELARKCQCPSADGGLADVGFGR